MNLDEMIAVMQGAKEGKRIEYKENNYDEWILAMTPSWDWSKSTYRVAPEPKKRLIRVEELPNVFWVKKTQWVSCNLCTKFQKDIGFGCGSGDDFEFIFFGEDKNWAWSASPSGPWKSFEVEE